MIPALITFLSERREALNEGFARTRQRFPRLEPSIGHDLIRTVIEPLWRAVESAESEGALIHAAQQWYDLGLELAGRGFCPSGHTPSFWPALVRLGRAVPTLPVRQSKPFWTALANALWQLQGLGPTVLERWLATMESLPAPGLDLPAWMKAGTLTAWRCGLATQRRRALTAARQLPSEIGGRCLALPRTFETPMWLDLIEKMTKDPWYDPEFSESWRTRNPTLIGTVGRFRGLGGEFSRPPRVQTWNESVLAGVGHEWFMVHADVYGSCLQRLNAEFPPETAPLPPSWKLEGGGVVFRQGLQSVIPELGSCASVAANRDFLVASLHHSHRLFLVV